MTTTMTTLVHRHYDAPMGRLTLVASDRGLRAILWPNIDDERTRVRLGDSVEGTSPILDDAVTQLGEYFAGTRTTFELPLDLVGTTFQRRVWSGLADVPYGKTTTYGEQAAHLGDPKAVRAVASANGRNPVSIVLPCHRIVGADGSLTGFAAGLENKAWLLDHERRHLGLDPKWEENRLF